jgi:integrase
MKRGGPFVGEAVEEFLRIKAAREVATVASYSSILRGSERGTRKPLGLPFAVYFHNRKIGSLSHDEVATWFAQRVAGGSQAQKHKVSKGIRHFLDWAFKRGYIARDLASAVEAFRPGKPRHDWLTFDEIYRLIGAITEDRYRFAVRWLFFTGARVGEAISARHRDIRWRDEFGTYEWIIPDSKTHSSRTVLLPDELATAYRATVEANKPRPDWPVLWDSMGRGFARQEDRSAPITPKTINAALDRARDKIGLTVHLTAHVARHSFCTNWVHDQGRDDFSIERLSRQVGTSPEVLRRTYVHFDLKPDDLAAIKGFGRRSLG